LAIFIQAILFQLPLKFFTMKQCFYLKLVPNRPTFSIDMTAEERIVMMQHIGYWRGLMDQGFVVAFGPVMDPAAVYGIGIVEVDDEQQVKEFIANDPAATINRYEYYAMRAVLPNRQ
jgi:hypothetical protein